MCVLVVGELGWWWLVLVVSVVVWVLWEVEVVVGEYVAGWVDGGRLAMVVVGV